MMEYSFAPLEGVTYAQYRRLHRVMFGGATRYYTPFIAPDSNGSFKEKYLRELTTDQDSLLVPQLLVNNSAAFHLTARRLYELGFQEINLNAGCPSATVVSKHKGAGLLSDPAALGEVLEGIFDQAEQTGYRVSIKTRLGFKSPEEFPALLEVFQPFPVAELIVHARCREDYYEGAPDVEAFAAAAERCSIPLTYNGDICSEEDVRKLQDRVPNLQRIMIGRGAVANPAVFRELRGGAKLERGELRDFHDALIQIWLSNGLSPAFTVMRMKTLWTFMRVWFPDSPRALKAVMKAKNLADYQTAARNLFLIS